MLAQLYPNSHYRLEIAAVLADTKEIIYGTSLIIPGPSFGGGSRGSHDPPVTTKLKIYPSNILQNPPYCTNLQLKIKKILGTPLNCISHSLNAKYQLSSILQGLRLTYFGDTPAIQNSTPPPFKNSWARA